MLCTSSIHTILKHVILSFLCCLISLKGWKRYLKVTVASCLFMVTREIDWSTECCNSFVQNINCLILIEGNELHTYIVSHHRLAFSVKLGLNSIFYTWYLSQLYPYSWFTQCWVPMLYCPHSGYLVLGVYGLW